MTTLLNQGLLITLIGMGLVFLALILLWGLMALMVRIRFKSDGGNGEEEAPAAAETSTEEAGDQKDLRVRAAAVAVAAALGLQSRTALIAPPTPKSLSPWQVAQRSGQFSQNSLITSRKSRGSAR
jgi:sodium pump decarboxylase gamma subunit